MHRNGVIAVVVVVASVMLVGLWAARGGGQAPSGLDCAVPPTIPSGVAHTKAADVATLTWAPPPASDFVTTYVIEAGSATGANNQGTFVAPGTATSFSRKAPPGTYFVRLFARNGCGTSPASQEIIVTMP